MKSEYDYLFITNLPAFYKVNLYNEIAKHCRIFVIFIANSSKIRAPDFTQKKILFDYTILNKDHVENRHVGKSLITLLKIIEPLRYHKVVVGGWDYCEFWVLAFMSNRQKNCLALESSVFESKTFGVRKFIKKIFLSRIDCVFSSGEGQNALLYAINYKRKIIKTLGVGIFNQNQRKKINSIFKGKFLFVGRLAKEKNLHLLLKVFAHFPQFHLTLIGHGPLQNELLTACPANVKMVGHVPNHALAKWYQEHDVFILPSFSEPWGLVIEEALYYGLPVLVSNRVGCAQDLVLQHQVGLLFDPYFQHSLKDAIIESASQYENLCKNVERMDFKTRDAYQVKQYLEAIK